MNKDSFDVALMSGVRETLQKYYETFRKDHVLSDISMLNKAGMFLPGVSVNRSLCPLCGAAEAEPVFFARGMHIVTCILCHLTYSREVLTKDADRTRYQQSNFMEKYREIKKSEIYSHLESIKADYIMAVAAQYAAVKASMLDIGSSNGQVMLSAERQGWTAHGIEANVALVAESLDRGLHAKQGFFPDDMPDDWRDFDLITMLDVLEHVEQPVAFLKDVSSYLKPGGVIVIQVPNFNSLITRLEGATSSNFCHGHWSHFELITLDRTMEKAGFKKLFSETIISELDRILQFDQAQIKTTIQKITGSSQDIPEQLTADFLHKNYLGYKLLGIYRKA